MDCHDPPLLPSDVAKWEAFRRDIKCPFCGHEFMATTLSINPSWKALYADCDKCGGSVQWVYYRGGDDGRK